MLNQRKEVLGIKKTIAGFFLLRPLLYFTLKKQIKK